MIAQAPCKPHIYYPQYLQRRFKFADGSAFSVDTPLKMANCKLSGSGPAEAA